MPEKKETAPDYYLGLLVEQLKTQKPISPAEGEKFVSMISQAVTSGGPYPDWLWAPIWQAIHRVNPPRPFSF